MHEGFSCEDRTSVTVKSPVKENLLKNGNAFLEIILDIVKNSTDYKKPFSESHIKNYLSQSFTAFTGTRVRLHKNVKC